MKDELIILKPFFESPERKFHIRELSRILKINHTTIRQRLNYLVKSSFLVNEEKNITSQYKISLSQKYLNLKLYYNLEKLYNSGLIEELNETYDLPTIVVFGSYSKALDGEKSDIDLCVISNVKKEINTEKFKRILNREVSIHHFTKESWKNSIKKNPELINNICNGLTLAGVLEVLT